MVYGRVGGKVSRWGEGRVSPSTVPVLSHPLVNIGVSTTPYRSHRSFVPHSSTR